MNRADFFLTLCRWLACAALVDWLVGRTLTRAAIHMPKAPPVLALYQIMGVVGQFAFVLTGILALVTLGALIWQTRRQWHGALAVVLSILALASLVFVIIPPVGWWSVVYQVLALAALVLIGAQARRKGNLRVWLVPATAVVCGELYQLSAALNNALHFSDPAPFTTVLFNLGEALVVASGFVLWWAYARGRARWRIWLLALLPALAFAAMYLFNPSITGITAIWSMGLSLYLPWLLYALSIWFVTVTLLVSLRGEGRVGLAILLFAAGGYAPQLSTHAFLILIALWLLAVSQAPANVPASRASNALAAQSAQP